MNKYILVLFLLIGLALSAQSHKGVNTEFNKKYKKSRSLKTGTLTDTELNNIKVSLSKELKINLENNKVVAIHYFQYGKNCLLAGFNDEEVIHILNNMFRIASSLEIRFNIKNYYVYNSNSFFKSILSKQESFVLDTGLFKKFIFTNDENCGGFYLLKNDGSYLLYYGEDYCDEIETFLTK